MHFLKKNGLKTETSFNKKPKNSFLFNNIKSKKWMTRQIKILLSDQWIFSKMWFCVNKDCYSSGRTMVEKSDIEKRNLLHE